MNYAQMFLMSNSGNLPAEQMPYLQQELATLDDESASLLMMTEMKSPTTALILSLFAGSFGVDRFYIRNKELGIGKLALFLISLFTMFIIIGFFLYLALGVWVVVDWFMIMKDCKQGNFERLMVNLQHAKNLQASRQQPATAEQATVTPEVVPAEPVVEPEVESVEKTAAPAESPVSEPEAIAEVELEPEGAEVPPVEIVEDELALEAVETEDITAEDTDDMPPIQPADDSF